MQRRRNKGVTSEEGVTSESTPEGVTVVEGVTLESMSEGLTSGLTLDNGIYIDSVRAAKLLMICDALDHATSTGLGKSVSLLTTVSYGGLRMDVVKDRLV